MCCPMSIPDPFALYIHIPYCLEKCPYCDFHSIAVEKREIPYAQYAECLIRQWKEEVERHTLNKRKLISIFFGGGTPSLMSVPFFENVLDAVAKKCDLAADVEITVETNPATATTEDFKAWWRLGINRLSIGVQSFQDGLLKKLGRNHTGKEAKEAIAKGLEAGFENISADFIFGIEGETLREVESDLETALRFHLPHLSVYQLTVEANTPLAARVGDGRFQMPEEDLLGEMHQRVPQLLEAHGLERYEISNYARTGFESRHNLQYWRYRDFLGIGSGAYSFIGNRRWRTTRKLKEYLGGNRTYEEEENLSPLTREKERWMMGLRLREGIFCGSDNGENAPVLADWVAKGWLVQKGKKIALSGEGFLWYNQLIKEVFTHFENKDL